MENKFVEQITSILLSDPIIQLTTTEGIIQLFNNKHVLVNNNDVVIREFKDKNEAVKFFLDNQETEEEIVRKYKGLWRNG